MITVTVTQSPVSDCWWVTVESDVFEGVDTIMRHKEYRAFDNNIEACVWGLRTAERMQGRR